MASTVNEIEELIAQASGSGFRGRLLERGMARSMIWSEGILPEGSPNFSERLSYDLLSYGYTILSLGIRLRELQGDPNLTITAFERAASAIADVIHNGEKVDTSSSFHRVIAASSYHLGHFSAKAFSFLSIEIDGENISLMERMLALLILRRFSDIENQVTKWRESQSGSDSTLAHNLEVELDQLAGAISSEGINGDIGLESSEIKIVDLAITDNYISSMFEFLFSLEIGNRELLERAIIRLDECLSVTARLNMIPQWWVIRITKHLFNDLWASSFHTIIPSLPQEGIEIDWPELRHLFITSLYKRDKAEIDLWPSQIEGANRAVNDTDDLVVSLPTSAGKTRVAEICILRCLATRKRVLFITPLRALSAQTEASLRKTFHPLGKSVSSLYGSMGTSSFEQNVIATADIVVGTPEKLDFSLRNDPSLIDDIGLVVLDEGHMIGLNEREIRYEVQIQRLLNREDASERRIVCLSAILPDGDQLEDFTNWLRRDKEGNPIRSLWRPTDLRFGEISWHPGNDARLGEDAWKSGEARINFTIGEEQPFIPRFIQPFIPPKGQRKTPFPKDKKELTLASAWKLVEDNHTVLIYCPEKRSVNSFAKEIFNLHKRGALDSLLSISLDKLELAITLGTEWLGSNHPIVECLKIGVAVHHGSLPTPFRKEMERLLREGILKVTVSSPTLAQGLNLTATAVIVYSLTRNRQRIDASEFKNVIGRAGRAFIDTHGLVLFPIFERHARFRRQWRDLIKDTNARNMESGMVLLVAQLLNRMANSLGTNEIDALTEYIANSAQPWDFPAIASELESDSDAQRRIWESHIANLDTAILSLLGEEEISIIDIPSALDNILSSSLWQRRLNHHEEDLKNLCNSVLYRRANHIWNVTTTLQRKGYFLSGVGLTTGQRLDEIAEEANRLLVLANGYIDENDEENAIESIISLAELAFTIEPFSPRSIPDDWKSILTAWLKGEVLTEHNFYDIDEALIFVEDGLIYRLPWALEAIRVRAIANEDEIVDGIGIEDCELGYAVPAIESGTLNKSAAILMQAGFTSRNAAIRAITSTNATFTTKDQLKKWLGSEEVFNLSMNVNWPTPETSKLWLEFVKDRAPTSDTTWKSASSSANAIWNGSFNPIEGEPVKLVNTLEGNTHIIASNGEAIGTIDNRYELSKEGIYVSTIDDNLSTLNITYWGASKTPFSIYNGN